MRATWMILAALAVMFSAMVLMPGEAEAEPGNGHQPGSHGERGGGAPGAIIIQIGADGSIVYFYWDFSNGENGPAVAIRLPDGSIVYAGNLAH